MPRTPFPDWLYPMAATLTHERFSGPGTVASLSAVLSAREVDMLRLVARGLGHKEIAAELGITTHTVKFHLTALLDKLGVRSRTEAISIGVRWGRVPR